MLVGGSVATKSSRLVSSADPLEMRRPAARFVSRGGLKLDAALDAFGIDVVGRRCLDAGASTGGFTDCLLQRGAMSVLAVDVGKGQLDQRLRSDGRVTVRESTNLRFLSLDALGGVPYDLVVADLSFISLELVARVLVAEMPAPGADIVVLVKPQFEAGRTEASRGHGVIRDDRIRWQALCKVAAAFESHGAKIEGAIASPLHGAAGNVELFLHARAGCEPVDYRGADAPPAGVEAPGCNDG